MKYQYWLANIHGIGNRNIHKLLEVADCAEEIYFSKKEQLQKIPGISNPKIEALIESKQNWDLDGELVKLSEKGIDFWSVEMQHFPECLKQIEDAPYAIYVKGRFPPAHSRSVALVGARSCSRYGRIVAEELGEKLARSGVNVVSGMALGIDSFAHWGALEGKGNTFAVLGCGVDVCYPAANCDLYDKILEQGGIISEYPPGTQPIARLFPARNRIISAISQIVVVIEAREKSGSLITADYALEQGKDVYAVPGGIYDSLSKGCNSLIRQGAGIISDVDEFLKELEFIPQMDLTPQKNKKLSLEKDEMLVYSVISLLGKSLETLLKETALELPKMLEVLESLQQKGLIEESFKNFYIRRN